MLKVRLMGTKNDIKQFRKILQRNPKIEVTEFSDLYPNKGTKKFHRAYVEVRKSNVKENEQKAKEKYFVENYSSEDIENIIIQLLDEWKKRQQKGGAGTWVT